MVEEPRPQRREDLPKRIWPAVERVAHRPDELDELASRPESLLPIEDDDPHRRELKSRLAQYKGRTPEGRRKSLANLTRWRKLVSDKDIVPTKRDPTIPAPRVPMAFPKPPGPGTKRGRALRAVLSQDELDIYEEHWYEWMGAHADEYTEPEDFEDVRRICMEKVLQYRMEMEQMNRPTTDVAREYNQSVRRVQQARENLLARRSDRVASAKNKHEHTHSVIAAAGELDAKVRELDAEEVEFLEGTQDNMIGRRDEDIIDVESEPSPREAEE